jgi:hypothetical protein
MENGDSLVYMNSDPSTAQNAGGPQPTFEQVQNLFCRSVEAPNPSRRGATHGAMKLWLREKTTSMIEPIIAVEYVRRMSGGSQPHLLRCSDGWCYVVKFWNNPQGAKILTNELLGTSLAALLGLPISPAAVVRVDQRFIEGTDELVMQLPKRRVPCKPGLCFGSRFVSRRSGNGPLTSPVYDILPNEYLRQVKNLSTFTGVLLFDKWTGNTDWRQMVFTRKDNRSSYTATMIDQGNCFGAEKWTLTDAPPCGLYHNPIVYEGIRGIETFEPWLASLEQLNECVLRNVAKAIPPEWCDHDVISFNRLLDQLDCRRDQMVRLLCATWKASPSRVFPNWRECICRVATA